MATSEISPALNLSSRTFSFRAFCSLLGLLIGLGVLLFLLAVKLHLPVTGENMYPESAGVLTAQRWAQGFPLYGDYRQPPYLVTSFPPLWYATMALAAKAGMSNLDTLTLFGRALSLCSLLGIVLLAYSWQRKIGIDRQIAVLGPGLYLAFPVLIPWAITARPDFPALFFSFLAIYCAGTRRGTLAAPLAGLASAAAFLMRHNSVGAPTAIVLWMLWSKRWKSAAVVCATWGLVVGLALVPFQLSSPGMLALNLSGAKFGKFAFTYAHDILGRIIESDGNGFTLLLLVFGVLGLLSTREKPGHAPEHQPRLLGLYLALSFGFAVFGSAAAGAAVNHFLEPALALAVLSPSGIESLKRSWKNAPQFSYFTALITLVLLVPSLDAQRSLIGHSPREDFRGVVPLLQGRHVFTDIPYLAARSSSPQLVDLISLTNSERRNQWSPSPVIGELQSKHFELVILDEPASVPFDPEAMYPRYSRMDLAVRTAIRKNYGLCFEVSTAFVYSPLSETTGAPMGCPSSGSSTITEQTN